LCEWRSRRFCADSLQFLISNVGGGRTAWADVLLDPIGDARNELFDSVTPFAVSCRASARLHERFRAIARHQTRHENLPPFVEQPLHVLLVVGYAKKRDDGAAQLALIAKESTIPRPDAHRLTGRDDQPDPKDEPIRRRCRSGRARPTCASRSSVRGCAETRQAAAPPATRSALASCPVPLRGVSSSCNCPNCRWSRRRARSAAHLSALAERYHGTSTSDNEYGRLGVYFTTPPFPKTPQSHGRLPTREAYLGVTTQPSVYPWR